MRIRLIFIFFIIILCASSFIFYTKEKKPLMVFTSNHQKIYLEIAKTNKEHQRGLMFRQSLQKNHGMIFLFKKPQQLSFWMKNTLIPLDMIFLNHRKIVAIFYNVPPCPQTQSFCPSYSSSKKADAVIELNAGLAKELELEENQLLF